MALSKEQYTKYLAAGVRLASGLYTQQDRLDTVKLLLATGHDWVEGWSTPDKVAITLKVSKMTPAELGAFWAMPQADPGTDYNLFTPQTALAGNLPAGEHTSYAQAFAKWMGWTDVADGLVNATQAVRDLIDSALGFVNGKPEPDADDEVDAEATKSSSAGWWIAAGLFVAIVVDKGLGGRR